MFGAAAYVLWGMFPLYWTAPRAGRRGGAPGPPGHLVGRRDGGRSWRSGVAGRPCSRWCATGVRSCSLHARGRRDLGQLGRLHLGRQQRPGRRDVARLLHQPAGHRADGRLHPRRAPAAPAVDRHRHRRLRSCRRAHARLRATAVGRAGAGVLASAPTGWPRSRPTSARSRASPSRRWSSRRSRRRTSSWLVASGAVQLRRHGLGHALLLTTTGHRHRDPAPALRRRRDPASRWCARAAAVPRADHPVRPRRLLLPRGHAARPLGRLRPGVARAGRLHRRGAQPPSSARPSLRHLGGVRGRVACSRTCSTSQAERCRHDVGERLQGRRGPARRSSDGEQRLGRAASATT